MMSKTPPTPEQIQAMYKDVPENCTLCGGSFEVDGKRVIYPYPMKHWLCKTCFIKSLDAGLGRLNKVLATGNLDLSVDEIADLTKAESQDSQQLGTARSDTKRRVNP